MNADSFSGDNTAMNETSSPVKRKGREYEGDAAFFSLSNFDELVGYNQHLEFAEQIIEKYSQNLPILLKNYEGTTQHLEDDIKKINSLLQNIKAFHADKKLNISVIGEFSTGKSTFINAFIRKDVLQSSALQGTTVSTTIIEYGDNIRTEIKFKDGTVKKYAYKQYESLVHHVKTFANDPEIAQNLSALKIMIPSENLENIFRILDTPGIRSLDSWHEEVTKSAILNLSDMSIILIDACKILPESFCSFISNNLEEILPQSIFVVTKIDAIPEEEHQMVKMFLESKIAQVFPVDNPLILFYSSKAVKEYINNPDSSENSIGRISVETEKAIKQQVAKLRVIAKTNKLLALLNIIYESVYNNVNDIYTSFQNTLQKLQNAKNMDFTEFITEQKNSVFESISKDSAFLRAKSEQETKEKIKEAADKIKEFMYYVVDGHLKRERIIETPLLEFLEKELTKECEAEAQIIFDDVKVSFYDLANTFDIQMTKFQTAFKSLFKDFDLFEIEWDTQEYEIPEDIEIDDMNFLTNVENNSAYSAILTYFTATNGGTFIDDVIGNVFKTLTGGDKAIPEKFEKAMNSVLTPVNSDIDRYFEVILQKIMEVYDKYEEAIFALCDTEIEKYYHNYIDAINDKYEKTKQKENDIKSQMQKMKIFVEKIKARMFTIHSVTGQINNLINRKEL